MITIKYHDRNIQKDEYLNIVKPYIKPNTLLLDAGCGEGYNSIISKKIDKKKVKGTKIIGIDINKKKLEKNPFVDKKILGNINNLSEITNKKFDLIYAEWVFEHLKHPEKTIIEMQHCLKSDGKIVLLMPNNNNPFIKLNKFLPRKLSIWFMQKIVKSQRTRDQIFPAYYNLPLKKIKKLNNYFSNIEIYYFNRMGQYFPFSKVLQNLSNIYENTIRNHKLREIIILKK